MKLHFIGSRGYIEEKSSSHKNRSSLLLETNRSRILIDWGDEYSPEELKKINPDAIIITHSHPDHLFGLKKLRSSLDIPVYISEDSLKSEYFKKEDYQYVNFTSFKRLDHFKILNLEMFTVPILHSSKAPNQALIAQGEAGRHKICYASDILSFPVKYRQKLLGCDVYIGDLSTLKKEGLIRYDKKRDEPIGHASPHTQLSWCSKAGVRTVIFTHLGSEPIKMGDDQVTKKLQELSKEYSLNIILAKDGMVIDLDHLDLKPSDVEAITPKKTPTPQYGLIMVSPHGRWIYQGVKKGIVKTIKLKEHIGEPLYLISEGIVWGEITLYPPKEIDEKEFKKLYKYHRISEEEREAWSKKEKRWREFPLYYYTFSFKKYPRPIPIRLKVKGPQVFVKASNIEFPKTKQLNDLELVYYHSLSHLYQEELGDPFYNLHRDIALEMIRRGMYHSSESLCDREVELIKEEGPEWVKAYIKRLPRYTRAQVGDDFRIVLGWYSSLKRGKKLFKGEEKVPIREQDCKTLILAIIKELVRRGATFNRPETYKKYARELFEWAIKQIGEDKISWKKELSLKLPEGFQVSDIDIPFVKKLSNEELEELWKWLHNKWREDTGGKKVPENYLNANVFVQIERFKRGLIDETYEDKDKLDEDVRYAWQEYGLPGEKIKARTIVREPLPALEEEPEEITLPIVLEAFRNAGPVIVKGYPYGAYLCGRLVNEGKIPKDHDIDLAIRQRPDPRLIVALKRMSPKWLFKRLHPFFDKGAAGIGWSVPIYGYSLNPLPKELMKKGFYPFPSYLEKKVDPCGRIVIGVKPKSGFGKNEFFDIDEMWEKWGSRFIDHGILVQEKVDGRRMMCYKCGDRIRIITEDTHRDRSKLFPEIVNELKKIPGDWILDGEMVAYELPPRIEGKDARTKRMIGEHIPREDTAQVTTGQPDEEFRKKIVHVFYDILYWKESLVNKGFEERYEILKKAIPRHAKYIDVVRGEEANNMKDFYRLVDKYRRVSGSEGVVCKVSDAPYPIKYTGENRTDFMCKLKNLKEIDVMVLDIQQKKTKEGKLLPTYIYVCGFLLPENKVEEFSKNRVVEYNSKHYCILGRAYGTNVKCKKGDIVTIMPIRIREYKDKQNKRYFTWMFPYFKEKRPDKHEADTLTTVERIAKIGTGPAPSKKRELEKDDQITVTIKLDPCPFWNDPDICPLLKRFRFPRDELSNVIVEQEILRFPIICPLAKVFKCRFVKDYYYKVIPVAEYSSELSDGDIDINELLLPELAKKIILQKYMECPCKEESFVMQSHRIGITPGHKAEDPGETWSQHCDFRMKTNGYLVGWSIVGGHKGDEMGPEKFLKNIGKGFRAETKARQPLVWMDVQGRFKPGEVGAGIHTAGEMWIQTKGKVRFGAQKPYFHEYFLKDDKYFKDWTRVIIRAINVPKISPETKVKTPHKELMWRFMIPKEQMPYTISNRAMKEGWIPPKSCRTPFPEEWVKKKWPEQYAKWEEYMKSKKIELSNINYTFSMHSYRGPVHVRAMWRRAWYLMLDDKGEGKVRIFRIHEFLPVEKQGVAINEGRDSRKYMSFEGKTRPDSRFNPNEKLVGEMKIISSGKVSYDSKIENGKEVIHLKFPSGTLKGEWILEQEEKGSDIYTIIQAQEESLELGGVKAHFVYHKHIIGDRYHFDLRYVKEGDNVVNEYNLHEDLREKDIEEPVQVVKKTCSDISWMHIKKPREVRYVGPLKTIVEPIDEGDMLIIEENPDFISYKLNGKILKGYYIAKKTPEGWIFEKARLPKTGLSGEGNPRVGPFRKFVIKEKKNWDHFIVYIYDFREFTRCVSPEKVKKYLPNLKIPEGVEVGICLYPVPGRIHHVRVAYVIFKKDKWSYEDAEKWIRKNNLHKWDGVLIRE